MKSMHVFCLCVVALMGQCFGQQVRYAWGVDNEDKIYRQSGQWAEMPGRLVRISVGADNSVWGVSRNDLIWRWNGSGWQQLPGLLIEISAATADHVWGISRGGNEVWRWNVARGDWDKMPGQMRSISVASDGSVWAVDLNDDIFVWTGYKWQQFTCQARQISAGSATNVWAVTAKNEILRYSTATGSQRWEIVPGFLKQVSVGADGEVWGINPSDDVVRWTGSGWEPLGRKQSWVSVGPTVSGDHVLLAGRAWLKATITTNEKQFITDTCPAGWRMAGKADLEAALQAARATSDPVKALSEAFGGVNDKPIITSERVYPNASMATLNGWKFWGLYVKQATIAPINAYFPDSTDESDGTLDASGGFVGRCVQVISISPVQSDTGACSTQFSSAPDARFVNLSTIRVIDLGKNVKVPTGTLYGTQSTPAAPLTPKAGGGAFINYLSPANRAMLLEVDAQGRPGAEQDLGAAAGAGAIGVNGTTVAYLAKSSEHRLELKIPGAAPVVIMDNDIPDCDQFNRCRAVYSGRGIRWNGSDGQPMSGTQAMLDPMTQHRATVHAAGGNWFVNFDHANNFNAYSNPAVADTHWGTSMMMVRADGSSPKMLFAFGTSHSMDMRAISDGDRMVHVSLGDANPRDIRARVHDARTGDQTAVANLFGSAKYPDTRIGTSNGQPVFGIAGTGSGNTAGKIGDLAQMGCGQYALTYVISPATFTDSQGQWSSTANELGLLIFDKDLKITKRAFVKRGDDVDFVKTARVGKSALLVAWKTKDAEDYWATLVDVRGVMIQSPQKLPAGTKFDIRDSFVTLANGDVMWTARDGSNLKLYHLPQPSE